MPSAARLLSSYQLYSRSTGASSIHYGIGLRNVRFMEQVRGSSPASIRMAISRRTISPIARVYVAGWERNDAKLTAKSGRRCTAAKIPAKRRGDRWNDEEIICKISKMINY